MADGTPTNLASIFFSHCAKNLEILLGRCQIALPTRTVGFDLKKQALLLKPPWICLSSDLGARPASFVMASFKRTLSATLLPNPHPSTATAYQCQVTASRISHRWFPQGKTVRRGLLIHHCSPPNSLSPQAPQQQSSMTMGDKETLFITADLFAVH